MSFLSDLGSFIGEVKEYKDDITSSFQGVSDDVKSLKSDLAEKEPSSNDQAEDTTEN